MNFNHFLSSFFISTLCTHFSSFCLLLPLLFSLFHLTKRHTNSEAKINAEKQKLCVPLKLANLPLLFFSVFINAEQGFLLVVVFCGGVFLMIKGKEALRKIEDCGLRWSGIVVLHHVGSRWSRFIRDWPSWFKVGSCKLILVEAFNG
jgi:hypothetical protein